MPTPLTVFPVHVDGEIVKGEKLGDKILFSLQSAGLALEPDDVIVVTHKIVSKAEGQVAPAPADDDAREALIASQAVRIIRRRGRLIIAETRHGFVCANAGVDSSNMAPGWVCLLPVDPDKSARRIRSRIKAIAGADVGVIISDTFGRAWRSGQTNIAIGLAGISPFKNYRGTCDSFGSVLNVTNIAVADELAGAAELVMGKAEGVPVALVRGAPVKRERATAAELVRSSNEDLFR